MSDLTEALAAEHRDYQPKIDELRRLADDCDEERPGALIDDLDRALHFLERDLLPHAAAEDAVLYPAVARLLGSPAATDTMRRDHEEIRHLVTVLRRHRQEFESGVLPAAWREIRGVLYGLHAVVTLHVAKEEELYLPLVERSLDDDEAHALLEQMHHAVRGHGARS